MDDVRTAIGRALLGLLAEGRTVSYGAAAARAGISKGLVQHYFPDRARLLRHAATTLAARLSARLSAVPAATDPSGMLAGVLVALLPTDAETRLDEAAGRALFALALTDPPTNAGYREGRKAVTGLIGELVAAAAPGHDRGWVERSSRDLLGTLNEVATDLLLGELTPAEAGELVRQRVSRL